MPKIFVSTVPFGEIDRKPIEMLEATGWEFCINPLNRKLTPEEVGEMALDCEGLIAGTEDIGIVLERAKHLKIVSRVGIGLDSVPLQECKQRGIAVTYTPDAVTKAVAELTVGAMINVARQVCRADRNSRALKWQRLMGKRVGGSIVGLIGLGRIGTEVLRLLVPFGPKEILVNDLKEKSEILGPLGKEGLVIRQVEKDEIYRRGEFISLHVPLTPLTRNLINAEVFEQCRRDAILLNFARGGIVNETDLFRALQENRLGGAAIDVFEQEPYRGKLTSLDNVLLTQHMGSCSVDCRAQMEMQATAEVIRYFQGEPLLNEVPEEEFECQSPAHQ